MLVYDVTDLGVVSWMNPTAAMASSERWTYEYVCVVASAEGTDNCYAWSCGSLSGGPCHQDCALRCSITAHVSFCCFRDIAMICVYYLLLVTYYYLQEVTQSFSTHLVGTETAIGATGWSSPWKRSCLWHAIGRRLVHHRRHVPLVSLPDHPPLSVSVTRTRSNNKLSRSQILSYH